jgi:8-oxo-dGTP diphosphatase
MSIGRFYCGIGALIWSPQDEKYLLLRRSADKDFASGVWECVTGRVDQGESFEAAVHREVREEVGIPVRIDFIIGTTHFYRGAHTPENELLGVVYRCSLKNPVEIRTTPEHSEHRWVSADHMEALLVASDPSTEWIRRVLRRAEEIRRLMPSDLAQYYHETNFGLG